MDSKCCFGIRAGDEVSLLETDSIFDSRRRTIRPGFFAAADCRRNNLDDWEVTLLECTLYAGFDNSSSRIIEETSSLWHWIRVQTKWNHARDSDDEGALSRTVSPTVLTRSTVEERDPLNLAEQKRSRSKHSDTALLLLCCAEIELLKHEMTLVASFRTQKRLFHCCESP